MKSQREIYLQSLDDMRRPLEHIVRWSRVYYEMLYSELEPNHQDLLDSITQEAQRAIESLPRLRSADDRETVGTMFAIRGPFSNIKVAAKEIQKTAQIGSIEWELLEAIQGAASYSFWLGMDAMIRINTEHRKSGLKWAILE